MSAHIHDLINFLQAHPHWGGFIAFLIAFSESIAIIGSIIPGSVTMTAIGALIGASVLPATSTLIWAMSGAVLGDLFSYWLGYRYQEQLRKIWPFRRYPALIDKGEDFFHKHGGKSVIIGRYAGVMRSAVPMIAGILHMPFGRFVVAAVPAAVSWAIIYMLPGIAIGALALELPAGVATKFILFFLLAIALAWVLFWLTHLFFRTTWNRIDQLIARWWQSLNTHRPTHWICVVLRDPHSPDGHQQLTISTFILICGLLFILTALAVYTQHVLTVINAPIHSLLLSFRTHIIDNVMLCFTLLGNKITQLIFAVLIALSFAALRHYRALIHWILIGIIGGGAIEFFKLLIKSPRPGHLLNGPTSFSFPSGHTTLSIIFFGFLAVIISQQLPYAKRRYVYWTAAILVALIGFSRMYLGAHWPTDIIGSIFLGLTTVLLFSLSLRRKPAKAINATKLISLSIVSLLLAWMLYAVPNFTQTRYDYTPSWPTKTMSLAQWWQQSIKPPAYIDNRFGKPNLPINVQWLATLQHIQTTLTNAGWKSHEAALNLKTAMVRLHPDKPSNKLPLLPKLFHNQPPALLMTKANGKYGPWVLRLWHSDITINDSDYSLWVGTLNQAIPSHYWLTRHHKVKQFITNLELISRFAKPGMRKIVTLSSEKIPADIERLHWDGQVLLIRSDQ